MKHSLFCFTLATFFLHFRVSSQTGGNNTYEFITLPVSARSASLGGYAVSVPDDTTIDPQYTSPYIKGTQTPLRLTFWIPLNE